MKILVTRAAGFIGYYTSKKVIKKDDKVIGLHYFNDCFDLKLKYGRLNERDIYSKQAVKFNFNGENKIFANVFKFILMTLEDRDGLAEIFNKEKFDVVC